MWQDWRNIDTLIVKGFFYFFGILTFYHVGLRMQFVKKIIEKFKGLFMSVKQKSKIQNLPPELISIKYNKLSDFLTGKGKLQSFDKSHSLFLTNVTPVTLLGIPTSVYLQGAQYFVSLLSFPIAVLFTNSIFVPVFYTLKVKTANQYIDKRFNFTVKFFCLIFVIAANLARIGIWLNTPNLILTNFTVISSETALILTIVIVVIYTSLGGMEVMQKMERNQLIIMLFSLSSVLSKGLTEVGGLPKVIEENRENNRFNINLDPNPFTNLQTFWSILSVNTFSWCTTYSIQQTALNRYLPSGSLPIAKRIIYNQIPLMMLYFFVICFIGLVMYTFYFRCDPLMTNRIDHLEALVGLFAADMNYDRGGILGLLIVAIYSITLSSTSSSLNGLSTIVFEDILKFYRIDLNFELFLRISMFIFGIFIVLTMLIVTQLKQSLRLRTMLTNSLIGPVFGIFLLGLHSRRVNSNCALIALLISFVFSIFTFFSHFQDSEVFLSIGIGFQDCLDYFCLKRENFCVGDETTGNLTVNVEESKYKKPSYRYPFSFDISLFKYLSFMYDGWIITIFTILIGLTLSLFIKEPDKSAQEIEECLATYMRTKLPTSSGSTDRNTQIKTELDQSEYYVHSEVEDDSNKEEAKDETKSGETILTEIDMNYLRKAIEEILQIDK